MPATDDGHRRLETFRQDPSIRWLDPPGDVWLFRRDVYRQVPASLHGWREGGPIPLALVCWWDGGQDVIELVCQPFTRPRRV